MPRKAQLRPGASPLAKEVYRRMVEAGMGQRALALRAGLGATYVRDLFAGKSQNPKSEQLDRLAEALGCSAEDLKNDNSRPYSDPHLRNFVDPTDIFPLLPAEVGLIRMFRLLDRSAKDQLLLRATELLPGQSGRTETVGDI